jgi:hypothetical protein
MLWAYHFAHLCPSKGVQVLRSWREFFTNALLHPNRFVWAKTFLESKAWEMTVSDKGDEMCFSFTIPANCPLQKPMGCSDTHDHMLRGIECLGTQDMSPESQKLLTPQKQVNVPNDSMSTSALLLKRKQSKAPIVDTEVRRSERLKGKHQGYKSNSCLGRVCFCRNIEAPTLSTKVIKNLGKDFCHIPGEKLNEEMLKKKSLAKKTAGPRAKQGKKGSQDQVDQNDELPKKKNMKK